MSLYVVSGDHIGRKEIVKSLDLSGFCVLNIILLTCSNYYQSISFVVLFDLQLIAVPLLGKVNMTMVWGGDKSLNMNKKGLLSNSPYMGVMVSCSHYCP